MQGKGRGYTRGLAILERFADDSDSDAPYRSRANLNVPDDSRATAKGPEARGDTIHTKTNKDKFLSLIEQSRGLLTDLQGIQLDGTPAAKEPEPQKGLPENEDPLANTGEGDFYERRRTTILKNIQEISEMKYGENKDKQEEFVKEMNDALEEDLREA